MYGRCYWHDCGKVVWCKLLLFPNVFAQKWPVRITFTELFRRLNHLSHLGICSTSWGILYNARWQVCYSKRIFFFFFFFKWGWSIGRLRAGNRTGVSGLIRWADTPGGCVSFLCLRARRRSRVGASLRCFCSRKRVSWPVPALFPLLSPRCLDDLNILPLTYFQVRVDMSFVLSTEPLRHKTYPAVCLRSQGYCLTKMTPKFVFF